MIRSLSVHLAICFALVSLTHADTVTRFRTVLDESYVILGGVQGTGSNAGGYAEFTLTEVDGDPTLNTLEYFIQFENVDLDGAQTPDPLDNISALHIHDTTECAPQFPQCMEGTDTAGTVHLLNIFGAPRPDDGDVMVDPVAGTISGLWDIKDTSPPGTPVPTLSIADPDVLSALLNEEAALFVHTAGVPTAAAGGVMEIVPEPASLTLCATMLLVLALRRKA